MKFTKYFTRREAISGGMILCGLVLMAAVFFFPGGRSEPETARYSGKNGSIHVQFTRYRDYDTFLEKKSPDIWIYNSREELKDVKGFIAGEVSLDGHWENVPRCNIKLVRMNGKTVSDILLMNMTPDQKENPHLPFTIYDYDESGRSLYKTAIVQLEEKNIEIPVNLE
ncbi:hypothetical protein [Caproiciproducens faecalis]|uniref:DUF4825 domain-containing protein n=1 Tax=Caproiciproducens faecalis TaxID=2820301 RepID=A0ABS7DNH0_9FIRM|nr:hypothetical protein [Caproiciproducens faecalis]MBW7572832.1 hypothetical protein [Caproiciproducens faecalis]